MRYTSTRIAKINVGEGMELSFIADVSVKWCSQTGKLVISWKLKYLSYDSAALLLGIIQEKWKHMLTRIHIWECS